MRCFLLSCSTVLVLGLLYPFQSFAQDHVKSLLGAMVGYSFISYHSDAFPILNSYPNDFMAQNGNGRDLFWGVSYEDPLSSDMHHFLILELGYNSMSGDFSTVGPETPQPIAVGQVFFSPPSPDTIYLTSAKLQAELSYLYLNVGYKFNVKADSVPDGFGLQLCFEIGLKMNAAFRKSVSDQAPNSDTTQISIAETNIASPNTLRFALRSELTYDLPLLNSRFVLTPFVGFDAPLTQVDQAENWTASAWFGGIYLRYAFW